MEMNLTITKNHYSLFTINSSLFLSLLLFAACSGSAADPRDTSYEFQTAEMYRSTVTVLSGGAVKDVPGEGGGGVFDKDKTLAAGYGIAMYETTWELWSEVYGWALGHGYSIVNAGTEGHGTSGTGGDGWAAAKRKTRPVTGITWLDAVLWCNAYSELSGLEPVYYTADGVSVLRAPGKDRPMLSPDKNGFRLPLETEWEYAARGGSLDETMVWNYAYSGGSSAADVAWYDVNAGTVGEGSAAYGAHPVGSKAASRLGLFDMSGNAAEWCWDSYSEGLDQSEVPDDSVSGSLRVVRGGGWRSAEAACKVTARDFLDPGAFNDALGFRIARTVPDSGEGSSEEEEEPVEPLPQFTGLPGTKWLWGQSLLEFDANNATVKFRGTGPAYTYTVTGGALEEGKPGGGTITTLGAFTINAERTTLEVIDYRNGGTAIDNREKFENKVYNAVFTRRDPAALTTEYLGQLAKSTLMGTEWNVGAQSGGSNGDRFKNCQWIVFFTKTVSVNRSANFTNIDEYTFNKNSKRGWIYFINDFILRDDDWSNMYIPSYKQYGHDMWCCRVR